MRRIVNGTTALALTLAALPAPLAAQATDRMAPAAQPAVQPKPTTRPAPQPQPQPAVQPARPQPQPAVQPPRPQTKPAVQPTRPPPPPPPPPNHHRPPPPPPGGWHGSPIKCESWDYKYRACQANTQGGAWLDRVIAGNCRQGYSWGYRTGAIWVNHGCRAYFRTRYGGSGHYYDDNSSGSSTGAVIAGVAIAGGLLAILASSNSSSSAPPPTKGGPPPPPPPPYVPPPGSTGQPTAIRVDLGGLQADARPAMNTCLADAAKQIGATGGSEIGIDRFIETEPGNGGYRFRLTLKAIYPDQTRIIPMYCRATPTEIVELTFG